MELLPILYALLAAITGLSVGDGERARQPVVASAVAQRAEAAAEATSRLIVRAIPALPTFQSRQSLRLSGRPVSLRLPLLSAPLYFARRHE